MSWTLFRWTWLLEGPLHVGMPPAGSLNRTRLFVPARALWGALTAELARREAYEGKEPQYQNVGASLQDGYRFTYLFPAKKVGAGWKAWLPTYQVGLGLGWQREDGSEPVVSDRQFRRCLLSTRPGTSIDASTDAADDGSLRETECVEARWRDDRGQGTGPVAMAGYLFLRSSRAKDRYPPERRRIDGVDKLFVGGDTRYGLGRLRRASFDLVPVGESMFGASTLLDMEAPQVESTCIWAHGQAKNGEREMAGALELLGGWDRGVLRSFDKTVPLWQPGSRSDRNVRWAIESDGTWRAAS